jgi:hypothetical protein
MIAPPGRNPLGDVGVALQALELRLSSTKLVARSAVRGSFQRLMGTGQGPR